MQRGKNPFSGLQAIDYTWFLEPSLLELDLLLHNLESNVHSHEKYLLAMPSFIEIPPTEDKSRRAK